MPLYDFTCDKCGKLVEALVSLNDSLPVCCDAFMRRVYSGRVKVKMGYPMWVNKIDYIQQKHKEKHGRMRYVHPKEVGATD